MTLDVTGCARTAAPETLTAALLACAGVEKAHVDDHLTWALVTFDAARTDAASIIAAMSRAGLEVTVIRLFEADET